MLGLLSPGEIANSDAVAMTLITTFSRDYLGNFDVRWFMPAVVAFSVFGSINNSIIHGSRLTLSSTRNGHFPKSLNLVQSTYLTPVTSVVFNTGLSVMMVATDSIYG